MLFGTRVRFGTAITPISEIREEIVLWGHILLNPMRNAVKERKDGTGPAGYMASEPG